jgi:dihydrodipicolinate synthase/N-acetylneuraminate lyase
MPLAYKRNEVKDRVRSTWRGMCSVTIPSFTTDFKGLNAKAIAHDVQLGAKHGFWGTLIASESGTTFQEYLQFMEIAAEAAPKGFALVTHLSHNTLDEMVEAAKYAESLGFEGALLNYPPSFRPKSASDVVAFSREVSEQTDLALILFAVATWGFGQLDPAQFPHDALAEMSRFPTAAAIKYEAANPGMIGGLADVRRKVGDNVIVECPLEHYAPGLIDWFGMQWMGTSSYESYADRVPRWFKLLHDGKWDEGMKLYWSYQQARQAKTVFHGTFPGANLIHRVGWKYMGWLQGYSGGLLRMPAMRLLPAQMRPLRAGFAASGFDLPENDDGFWAGRFPTEQTNPEAVLAAAAR